MLLWGHVIMVLLLQFSCVLMAACTGQAGGLPAASSVFLLPVEPCCL